MPTAARIGFETTIVSVSEGSQFATLFVAVLGTTRLGGEVTVMFSTADLTAGGNGNLISLCVELSILWFPLTAGVDYATTVISTLTFSQSITRLVVRVPIIQDIIEEPTEQFFANLTIVENNGISVTVDSAVATVNITDDDSELGIRGKRKWEKER